MLVRADQENVDRVRLGLARQLLREGDAQHACGILDDITANQPRLYEWSWQEDGALYIRAWDLEEFMLESAAREATHRGPLAWVPNVYGQAHYYLAFALLRLHEIEQAEQVLLKALSEHGDHPRLHVGMALVRARRGEHAAAAESYCRALRTSATTTESLQALALRGLGVQLAEMGYPAEAERALEMSLGLDPSSTLARAELAQLRQRPRVSTTEAQAEEPGAEADATALHLDEDWPRLPSVPDERQGAVWDTGPPGHARARRATAPWWRRLWQRLQRP